MSDSSGSVRTAGSRTDDNVSKRKKRCARVSTVRHDHDIDVRHRIKVPPFAPEDPEIWFALLEGQFESLNIHDDAVKYTSVITNLDMTHAKAVKDIIIQPPAQGKYVKIKTELVRRLSASQEKKVKQLLTHEELGDRKPSQFLRHLQDLAGPSVPEDFIRSIWSNRLPTNLQTVLASQPTHSLEQLSDLADRIHELTTPCNVAATASSSAQPSREIAELRGMVERLERKLDEFTRPSQRSRERSRPQRRRSHSRRRSDSNYRKFPVCWYHTKYGSSAHKCLEPCDYKAGNASGSR